MNRTAVATRPEPSTTNLAYGMGTLELDLALQHRPDSGSLEINGALLDRRNGGLGRVPAYLVSGSQIVDEAMTDRGGSFHLATRVQRELRLCLFLRNGRLVELELDRLDSPRSPWAMRPSFRCC